MFEMYFCQSGSQKRAEVVGFGSIGNVGKFEAVIGIRVREGADQLGLVSNSTLFDDGLTMPSIPKVVSPLIRFKRRDTSPCI